MGSAMDAAAFSGIRFWLPATSLISLGTPAFSNNYANPDEVLFTGNGTVTLPLENTPGWQLDALAANGAYYLHTAQNTDYSFGTWGWVNGTHRIMGGGVFELTFPSTLDLFHDINFRDVDMDFVYGNGLQYISAQWIPTEEVIATPEPESLMLLIAPIGILTAARLKKNKTAQRLR